MYSVNYVTGNVYSRPTIPVIGDPSRRPCLPEKAARGSRGIKTCRQQEPCMQGKSHHPKRRRNVSHATDKRRKLLTQLPTAHRPRPHHAASCCDCRDDHDDWSTKNMNHRAQSTPVRSVDPGRTRKRRKTSLEPPVGALGGEIRPDLGLTTADGKGVTSLRHQKRAPRGPQQAGLLRGPGPYQEKAENLAGTTHGRPWWRDPTGSWPNDGGWQGRDVLPGSETCTTGSRAGWFASETWAVPGNGGKPRRNHPR